MATRAAAAAARECRKRRALRARGPRVNGREAASATTAAAARVACVASTNRSDRPSHARALGWPPPALPGPPSPPRPQPWRRPLCHWLRPLCHQLRPPTRPRQCTKAADRPSPEFLNVFRVSDSLKLSTIFVYFGSNLNDFGCYWKIWEVFGHFRALAGTKMCFFPF